VTCCTPLFGTSCPTVQLPKAEMSDLGNRKALQRAIDANMLLLKQRRKHLGRKHPQVAVTLERLAKLYELSKDTQDKAEDAYCELLSLQQIR